MHVYICILTYTSSCRMGRAIGRWVMYKEFALSLSLTLSLSLSLAAAAASLVNFLTLSLFVRAP